MWEFCERAAVCTVAVVAAYAGYLLIGLASCGA